jgi:Domain of unknown function (DUF4276)
VSMKLYIEGGGDGQLLDTLFRQGWSQFFRAADLVGRMPRIVRGQGRDQTFDMFRTAVTQAPPGVLPLLLVDSEDRVAAHHTVWQHLKARDNWDRPPGAADDQAFLMVQVMETWFLADRDRLRRYFGTSLRENHFSQWPDLEQVSKATVLEALKKATAGCTKQYSKGKISFELLGGLSPGSVRAACTHARTLLDRLQAQ